MIIRKHAINNPSAFYGSCAALAQDGSDSLMFYDIETTGLSSRESVIYLIGCMYDDGNGPVLTQFFSESPEEEADIIRAFNELLLKHPVLVDYNGSTFDAPFIRARAEILGIGLNPITSEIDIYRLLKPFKNLLGLKSMRMKAMEQYLGIRRDDMYDGGELIELYIKYVAKKKLEIMRGSVPDDSVSDAAPHVHERITTVFSDETGLRLIGSAASSELLEILLLHNYEDIINLPDVALLTALNGFIGGSFGVDGTELRESGGAVIFTLSGIDPAVTGILRRSFRNDIDSPSDLIRLTITPAGGLRTCVFIRIVNDTSIELVMEAAYRELKLFFANYRDYYYLLNEDYAIHKSIGRFMDRDVCIKCTAANCYTRKTGYFLPVFEKKGGALADKAYLYRQNAPDKANYILAEDLVADTSAARIYILQLLEALL